jgi:DMSO/TMAO reductase YedYZ molybdopterin-dependent catalytic subunit
MADSSSSGGCMQEEKLIKSPDTERKDRIPPGQRKVDDFPVLHFDGEPSVDINTWQFRIFGLVGKERKLSFKEFSSLPQVKVFSDIHCVTGWSKLNNYWEGVSTGEIRKLVTILPAARFVIVHSSDEFFTNIPIAEFFETDVLFALQYNDKPLTKEHGYPGRLVVPRLYFWKSAKWVTAIEFVEKDRRGFWESRGYHNHGDPWKEERYSG